jgi:hypothetical protein
MSVKIFIWILGIILLSYSIWYLVSEKEGFQSWNPDLIKSQFWDIISKKDDANVAAKIAKVRDPAPNDSIPVRFSNYISIYAMAKYNNDPVAARKALFSDYDILQQELSTNVFDQSELRDWTINTKQLSCDEINKITRTLIPFVRTIPGSIKDISGTIHAGTALRSENLAFQNKFKSKCLETPMSPDCIGLASQEDPIYPLLTKYNTVNNTLYNNEYDISNNLDVLNKTYMLLKCDNPNRTVTFNVERDTDLVDVELLTKKLQELSPYYISPETLKFITASITNSLEVDNTVQTTSDMYINIGNTINNIKTLTGGT